jgi:hypothetical protein
MRFALLGILLILYVSPCHAKTAAEMLSGCRQVAQAPIQNGQISIPATLPVGKCWGAFTLIDELATWVLPSGVRLLGSCPPDNSTRSQLVAVFVEYVDRNPQRRNDLFGETVVAALRAAFPCSPEPIQNPSSSQ